ncbi:MAG TPA: DMT family transporter [Gammaproteobacteria bacterium]|nr:DMT family transporter [Gammaproteobacteria bacterium]
MMGSKRETSALPVLALLFSATVWGVMWYPLRLFEAHGLSGLWVTLMFFAAAGVVGVLFMSRHLREMRRQPWIALGIALASGWCNTSFNLAVLEGNVMRMLLLFYLSPLWATLIGWWFLGERLTLLSVLLLVVSVLGALFMLWQPGMMVPWPAGRADWLAISSGMSFAVLNALVRRGRLDIPSKMLASWFGAAAVAGGWIAVGGEAWPVAGMAVIGAAAAFGALVIVVATLSVQYGVTHMPLHRSAVILLFELVAGALSAWLLTDEVITPKEWFGGGLIVVAALISARAHLGRG